MPCGGPSADNLQFCRLAICAICGTLTNDRPIEKDPGLMDGKIGRVIFCIERERMVLLHGFIKKRQEIPAKDLRLALKRTKEVT